MNILIVEDDPEMRDFLVQGLTQAGHKVITASDGANGLELALRETFDVMVLDRMLPGLNGIEVLTTLRNRNVQRPVLMLSALGDVDHRVTGLKHGADDYLAKPFSLVELCARLDALHRRDMQPSEATTLQVGDLKLDLLAHSAQRGEQVIDLWPLEFRLLEYLVRNAGRVVTRNMLLENVWNLHFDPQTNVVEVHMSRLRGKIDKGFDMRLIHTVRGSGYVLRAS
jgi:two-component system, OmpR family, response regulator